MSGYSVCPSQLNSFQKTEIEDGQFLCPPKKLLVKGGAGWKRVTFNLGSRGWGTAGRGEQANGAQIQK